jgi:oligopeptide/dipeptide ABC transporter ATP-binding protein
MNDIILNIERLETFFETRNGLAKAVNGVSYHLKKGEVVGVVGESGSGKSVTALSILRLVPFPGKIVSGKIFFHGKDLMEFSPARMRQIRGDRISMIFQEPMTSLNPALTIEEQLVEAQVIHRKINKSEGRNRAIEMLRSVDIPAPDKRIKDYPHQLSGGMRQRVMIAEALLLNPDVLLADEPTTALDVTIQAQFLDIMYKLTQEMGTAVILITHNLGLVAENAQRVEVMYAGRGLEEGPVKELFDNPSHPYTRGLLKSIPVPNAFGGEKHKTLYEMKGLIPSLFQLPTGCAFHPRCPERETKCVYEEPPWCQTPAGHNVLCWHCAGEKL